MKPKTILLLPLLLLFLTALASASVGFEISGTYTEEGQRWLNEHWGENITIGDVQRIAYDPEVLRQIEENVDPETLAQFRNRPHYWGSREPWGDEGHPECPYGANVWDESGPVNISALGDAERQEMLLENVVTDRSGYRIVGRMNNSVSEGELASFQREMPEGLSAFGFDIFWENRSSSLKATIFAPDGVMGPYYDADDGKENGRIFLHVSRSEGIAAGDWYVVVEAEKAPAGGQQFMMVIY
jgi:hypothetical protein